MIQADGWRGIAALCMALLLAACGSNAGDGNSPGMATVRVGLGAAVPSAAVAKAVTGNPASELAGVAAVNLTVSAADMATVSVALPLDGRTITLSIPAGLNRVFSVSAYDAVSTMTHTGSTTIGQLIAGVQTSVSIALNAVIPDTTPPSVQSTTPVNSATGIATGATIRIVFSEAMNAATINGSNITVNAPGAIAGSVNYDAVTSSALFTPTAPLPTSTVINVGLSAAITDLAGNPLSGAPYTFSFTTAAAPPTDTTPPTVLSTSPANGATATPTDATIAITFSEAMDCATLASASFGVSGATAVAGTVGCSVDTATFTPSASWAGDTTYTATVTTSVKDVAGNPMASIYTWSFTTVSSPALSNTWTGLVDNSWSTTGNWSLGHAPTANETVDIPDVAGTLLVQVSGGQFTVKSITSAEPFVLSGAGTTLTLTQDGTFSAALTLEANTSLVSQGTLSLSSSTLGAGAKIDLTQSGAGILTIGGMPYTVINSLGAAGSVTATDLQGMNGNLTGFYALGSNIDASPTSGWNAGAGFAPVGTSNFTAFTGRFDGLGHTITGLSINRPAENNVGLFGYAGYSTAALIRNVGLVNVSVTGGQPTGALVGLLGAIATSTVSNVYSTGNVTGTGYAGGLVGRNNVGAITKSYSAASVTGSGSYTGGLAGNNSSSSSISNSYSTGNVSGNYLVGGLTSANDGVISNSYNTGNVAASWNHVNNIVGGLTASNWGAISYSYSAGGVSAGAAVTRIGGFAGENAAGFGTITNSYWDTTNAGTLPGIGTGTLTGATGLATAGMKAQASFAGWDFANTWRIDEGVSYPTLLGF